MSTPGWNAEATARRLCERVPELAALSNVGRIRLAEELQDAIDAIVDSEVADADEGWPVEGGDSGAGIYPELTGAEVA